MKKASKENEKYILEYLSRDVANCLYMYADIAMYGLNNKNIKVWYSEDNQGIKCIVMKYYKNFQVYSNRDFDDILEIKSLIDSEKPYCVSGRLEILNNLEHYYNDVYNFEKGVVFKGKPIDKNKVKILLEDSGVDIKLATVEDTRDIAELVCHDPELGAAYTIDSFQEELIDRISSGMGRSYIIRVNNKVVAHNATYAECDKFVVISGLMVHPDYRDTEYAQLIDLKSSLEFQEEGKDRYFFAIKPRIIRWHKFTKSPLVASYGKLSLINK